MFSNILWSTLKKSIFINFYIHFKNNYYFNYKTTFLKLRNYDIMTFLRELVLVVMVTMLHAYTICSKL